MWADDPNDDDDDVAGEEWKRHMWEPSMPERCDPNELHLRVYCIALNDALTSTFKGWHIDVFNIDFRMGIFAFSQVIFVPTRMMNDKPVDLQMKATHRVMITIEMLALLYWQSRQMGLSIRDTIAVATEICRAISIYEFDKNAEDRNALNDILVKIRSAIGQALALNDPAVVIKATTANVDLDLLKRRFKDWGKQLNSPSCTLPIMSELEKYKITTHTIEELQYEYRVSYVAITTMQPGDASTPSKERTVATFPVIHSKRDNRNWRLFYSALLAGFHVLTHSVYETAILAYCISRVINSGYDLDEELMFRNCAAHFGYKPKPAV